MTRAEELRALLEEGETLSYAGLAAEMARRRWATLVDLLIHEHGRHQPPALPVREVDAQGIRWRLSALQEILIEGGDDLDQAVKHNPADPTAEQLRALLGESHTLAFEGMAAAQARADWAERADAVLLARPGFLFAYCASGSTDQWGIIARRRGLHELLALVLHEERADEE